MLIIVFLGLTVGGFYLYYNDIHFLVDPMVSIQIAMISLCITLILVSLRLAGVKIGFLDLLKLFIMGTIEAVHESTVDQSMKIEEQKRMDARLDAARSRKQQIKDLNDFISNDKK